MTAPDTEPAAAPAPADRSKAYLVLISAGLVVALALLCIGGVAWNAFTGGAEPNGSGASTACKEYVKGRLKAPSTARFSGLSLSGSDSRWTVTGTVSAKNSFGGTVDMDFTCTVTGGGSNWSLASLTGLNG